MVNSTTDAGLAPLIDTASMGILLFVNSLIALFGTCGNVLVITAFFVSKSVRSTKYNFFLFSLAVADLLACLVCIPIWNFVLYRESLPKPPVSLNEIEDRPVTNSTADKIGGDGQTTVDHTLNVYRAYHSFLDPLFGVASIMNLLAVSVVRCLAVHWPVFYSHLRDIYFAVGAFVFPWGIGAIAIIYLEYVPQEWHEKMLLFIVLLYFIPLIIITFSYIIILLGVGISRINNIAEEASKHVVMIGLVVTCFVVTWLPFFTVTLIVVYCKTCYISFVGVCVIKTFQYISGFINVLIYAWQCKDFRDAFRKIFRAILCLCDKKLGRSELDPAWKDMGLSTASIAPVISLEV